jgi:pantothenate synthetase
MVSARIGSEPAAHIEYISLADDGTLEELSGEITRAALLSVVVRFGATRLLDNVELGSVPRA